MSYPYGSSGQSVRRQMMSFFVPTESTSNWGSESLLPEEASQDSSSQDRQQLLQVAVKIAKTTHQFTNFSAIVISVVGQNFLACLQHTFHNPSFITPEIVTFEGILISDAWAYRQHLTPGLHLIIYFPLAIPGDSPAQAEEGPLSLEWVQDLGSPFTNIEEGGSPSQSSTVDPAQIALTSIHPHTDMHHRIRERTRRAEKPLHFQPPSLSFYPLSKVPIAVTFANSLIRKAAYCSIKPEDNGEVSAEQAAGWSATPTSHSSSIFYSIPRLRALDRSWLSRNENGGDSSAPQTWSYGEPILPRPLSEGTFPLTTFDIFAQGSRRQIVCSVAWDAMAHPSGKISLADGHQQQSEISWDLGDVINSKVSAAARRVHWVNYVPPGKFVGNQRDESLQNDTLQYTKFTSSSAVSRRRSGRFWMLHPPRLLPTAFFPTESQMGSEDIHFHVPQPSQLLDFFSRAYRALGFPEGKGIRSRLDIKIDLKWEREHYGAEEVKLRKVVEGICSRGKGPLGVSLDGFKVYEWGGLLAPYEEEEVFEDKDDDDESESESGSETASDRTIRATSPPSLGEEDALMEDVSDYTEADEESDTLMGNDVDAVVLGEEGEEFMA
ncbi:hypothetical protein BGX38DRAFT_1264061 [Terfezia claveryi]|nr:hypothetical protein BGX38DRAFT_1264061 [Terfezia claveryi]